MTNIKCPNLVEWLDRVILSCEKSDRAYVPTLSELQRYCKSKGFQKCPYYVDSVNVENTEAIF